MCVRWVGLSCNESTCLPGLRFPHFASLFPSSPAYPSTPTIFLSPPPAPISLYSYSSSVSSSPPLSFFPLLPRLLPTHPLLPCLPSRPPSHLLHHLSSPFLFIPPFFHLLFSSISIVSFSLISCPSILRYHFSLLFPPYLRSLPPFPPPLPASTLP